MLDKLLETIQSEPAFQIICAYFIRSATSRISTGIKSKLISSNTFSIPK